MLEAAGLVDSPIAIPSCVLSSSLTLGPHLLLLQSPEKKKEEFRQYLERSGVIDVLTKVLVRLYEEPEKPANAIE